MTDLEVNEYIGKEVKAEIILDGEIKHYCGMLTKSECSGLYSVEGTRSIYGIGADYFKDIKVLKS